MPPIYHGLLRKKAGPSNFLLNGGLLRGSAAHCGWLWCGAGDGSVLADRRLVIATIGLLVVLPMCFPRDLGALAWVSMAAVGLKCPTLFCVPLLSFR